MTLPSGFITLRRGLMVHQIQQGTSEQGNNFRELRRCAGVTLRQLNLLSKISIGTLHQIERGKFRGHQTTITKYQEALHTLICLRADYSKEVAAHVMEVR